jgi:hypothetical protein
MTVKWSGPSGVIAPPIEGPITYELMAEDKSHSSRESSAIRQTSLASAPARGWRCWWRCDDPRCPPRGPDQRRLSPRRLGPRRDRPGREPVAGSRARLSGVRPWPRGSSVKTWNCAPSASRFGAGLVATPMDRRPARLQARAVAGAFSDPFPVVSLRATKWEHVGWSLTLRANLQVREPPGWLGYSAVRLAGWIERGTG